jgi:hypothetical protein
LITAQEVTGLNPVEVTNRTSTLQRICKCWFFLYSHFLTFLKTQAFLF